MWAVWLRVRAGLRQDWRGLAVLTLVTALMGSAVLVALAGAHRTATAVSRFLQYAGPTEGQVAGDSRTLDKIAALPGVAYTMRAAFMLAVPVTAGGRMAAAPGQVITFALINRPPQARAIMVAGRPALPSRAGEVMINEAAARVLNARVGSVIHLRGYRPDQGQQVLNGAVPRPGVPLPDVRVTGITRTPADLAGGLGVPTDVTFLGTGTILATAAFYHRFAASVASESALTFHLERGTAGLAAFETEVKRLAGLTTAEMAPGSDDATVAASVQRGTSVQALALLLFGVLVAMAMLVIVAQSIIRQIHTSADDFPVLRALGASAGQRFAVALVPGALVAAGGMALAIPVAYGLSALTPIGLARQAEISPGFSFDAAILLSGAAALALLLTGRTAVTALRVTRAGAGAPAAAGGRGSRAARWMAHAAFPPTAVSGVRLAFEPGRDRTTVPVRSAVFGMTAALAAVMAAVVFGSSLAHVIADPSVAGWNWDLAIGNPHSGDLTAQTAPRLRHDPDVAGFAATAMTDGQLDGRGVTVVGMQSVKGDVAPPVLAGRLPAAPGEIALGGRELRALRKRVGDLITARGARGPVVLHVVGQVILSPEITNEQAQLGTGAVMTLAGADALSGTRLPRNLFPVQLRNPADHAAIAHLKQQFPGAVLPAIPPPEVRNLQGVSDLPLILALLLTLLAIGTVAHTLVTSVRRRRRELAILKTVGFVARQVRATVAWQATAIAGVSLIIGLPLGILAGRLAWILFATQVAIEPVPVISPLVLLAIPAVIVLANAVAAFPARAAAHTQPARVLRTE